MNSHNSIIPKIMPVSTNGSRPFWSVMIPTYNCAKFLKETLGSVLSQDPGPSEMQIEVVDDLSTTDDPETIVNEVGKGRVVFHRNASNLGATRNFNNCLTRANGHHIHILHGDDFVDHDFYNKIKILIDRHPSAGFHASRAFVMDDVGILEGISPRFPDCYPKGVSSLPFAQNNYFLCPGIVINRAAVELTGGFDEQFRHVADWDLWVRLMFTCGACLTNEPLAYYRLFEQNDSARHRRLASNLREMLSACKGFHKIIPNVDVKKIIRQIEWMAFGQYGVFRKRGDIEAARANFTFLMSIVPIYKRIIWHFRDIKSRIIK